MSASHSTGESRPASFVPSFIIVPGTNHGYLLNLQFVVDELRSAAYDLTTFKGAHAAHDR